MNDDINNSEIRLAASGWAKATPGRLRHILLSATGGGSNDAQAIFKDGGSGGTIRLTLCAKAGFSQDFDVNCISEYVTDIYVTLVGTGAEVYVEYQ
jgi:hypothetical protein